MSKRSAEIEYAEDSKKTKLNDEEVAVLSLEKDDKNIDSELLIPSVSVSVSDSAAHAAAHAAAAVQAAAAHAAQAAADEKNKPKVGSEEWYKQRKDNHKEVERRRRENINDGIRLLAELLPSTDSNKAQILRRACEYIQNLKKQEQAAHEKYTLEKLLGDQALAEMRTKNEKLEKELEKQIQETEYWKGAASKKELQ